MKYLSALKFFESIIKLHIGLMTDRNLLIACASSKLSLASLNQYMDFLNI